MGWIGIFFLAVAVFAGLTVYLYHEKIYNEQKLKVSKFRGFSHINLFSLQYIGTLRATRVRKMVNCHLTLRSLSLRPVAFKAGTGDG